MKQKFPDRIPVIVERDPRNEDKDLPDVDKNKFLVPTDLVVSQFIGVIRKRLRIEESKSLFLFVGRKIPNSSEPMAQLYDAHKDRDGFLYVMYSGENTFGGEQ